jgi:hypothetical protein
MLILIFETICHFVKPSKEHALITVLLLTREVRKCVGCSAFLATVLEVSDLCC